MMNTNTGGPAFPVHPEVNTVKDTAWLGMTLRDYFAAKAMQGMLAENGGGAISNSQLANFAYEIADEMLKARGE